MQISHSSATPTTTRRGVSGPLAAVLAAALLAASGGAAAAAPARAAAAAGPSEFHADLRPMPVDDETKTVIAGHGQVRASFDGRRLTISADFEGLASPATEAFLMQSPYIAVPGTKIFDLTVAKADRGQVSGTVTLNRAQAAALRQGNLYVQVNSEKAPPGYIWGPRGTVWGWLLPANEQAPDGVPQQGSWYIPAITAPAR